MSKEIVLHVDAPCDSPYAMSVFVTLHEKGLPFTLSKVSLVDREHHRPEYARASLTARVPTLVHDGFSLSESSAICEYLEDVFPAPQFAPVYSSDPRQRARARQIQAWLRSDLMPIREERPTTVIFVKPRDQPLSPAALAAAARLFAAADALIPDGATSLFERWCIADTDLALMINRLLSNGDQVPAKLAAYARHQWQRPTVQRWVGLPRA